MGNFFASLIFFLLSSSVPRKEDIEMNHDAETATTTMAEKRMLEKANVRVAAKETSLVELSSWTT